MPKVVTLSPSQTQISTNKTAIAANGVESCTVSVTVKNTDETNGEANPMAGLRGNAVVLAVTPSTGVTITQPSGTANAGGAVTGSFVSTNPASVVVSATVLGQAVTSGGPTVVVGGGAPVPPPPGDPFYTQPTTATNVFNSDNGFTWASRSSRVTEQVVPAGRTGSGIRFRFGPDASGADSSAEQRFNLGRECPHLWLEYSVYIPSNYVHRAQPGESVNNKFAMFWRDTYSDVTNGTWRIGHETQRTSDTVSTMRAMSSRWDLNSWTDSGYSPTGQGATFISSSGPLTIGAWNTVRIEMAAATDQTSSDGIHRVWVNGTLVLETTTGKFWNFPTGTDPADCFLRNGYFFGWANSGFTDETDFFLHGAKFYETDPGWL